MSADHKIIRLAPLGGLNGSRVSDEGTLDTQRPVPMRGGYNVQVIDGEWWCRPGYGFVDGVRRKFASIPWWWIVPTANETILASPWHALLWRDDNTVKEAYTPAVASESITFTNGSASATSTTNPLTVGQIILTGTSGFTEGCYLIIAVSGTTITLERAFEGSTGAQDCRIIAAFGGNPLNSLTHGGDDPGSDLAGFALIDQLVSHSAGALYTNSVATTAGEQYMIITGPNSPVAFRTDGEGDLLAGWFRDTSVGGSSPTSLTANVFCASHQNRLIMTGGDPTGAYPGQTVWHSIPGDFLMWHTGVGGQTGVPHYKTFERPVSDDSFRAILPLGENLIIHSKYSQLVGIPQGSSVAPYRWHRLASGHGLTRARAIVAANRAHYLVTDHGLCVFDGSSLVGVQPEQESHLRSMRSWQEVRLLLVDESAERIYGFQQNAGDRTRHQEAAIPATATVTIGSGSSSEDWQNARSVWVYDYKRGVTWMEDHVTIVGGGPDPAGFSLSNGLYVVRFDGTVLDLPTTTPSTTGSDAGVTTGTHVVDALVDTPWIGMETRHRLHKVVIGFRALDLTTGGFPSITDLWSATTETLHLATVEVYTEGDITTPIESRDYNKLVSAMLALDPDENQQMPVMDIEQFFDVTAGMSFKLRIKNALSADATAAGHKKGLFRIAYIELYVVPTESGIPGVPDPAP